MTDTRLRSTFSNSIWVAYSVAVTTVFPFLIRTMIIRYIGLEYAGVSSLFLSILQVINIADLGIENAITYFLYKPMADRYKNTKEISSVLYLFRWIYRRVGALILAVGFAIMPFIPYLIRGKSYPADLNIYFVYGIYILNSAIPYFAGNYRRVLFASNQQSDILNRIGGTTALVMYVLQAWSLICLKNFYVYTVFLLINCTFLALSINISSRKYFPEIKCEGWPDAEFIAKFKKQILAMSMSKIRNVSRNSFDSIVISAFLGLTLVAQYQNYYQVMLVPALIVTNIRTIITPAFGNGIAVESRESNYGVLSVFTFFQNFILTVATACLLNLFQPFIAMWVGKEYLMPFYIVILFCIYFYVLELADIAVLMRETTGIWWQGRYVALIEAAANLLLNVLFVKIMGVGGVILATIITIGLINIPFEFYYIFHNYFKTGARKYILLLVQYTCISSISIAVSFAACRRIPEEGIGWFIVKAVLTIAVSAAMFCILHIRNPKMKESIEIIQKMLKIRG